jgi:hypothetical protein
MKGESDFAGQWALAKSGAVPMLPTAKRQMLRALGVTRDGRAVEGLLACVEALTRDGSLWYLLLPAMYPCLIGWSLRGKRLADKFLRFSRLLRRCRWPAGYCQAATGVVYTMCGGPFQPMFLCHCGGFSVNAESPKAWKRRQRSRAVLRERFLSPFPPEPSKRQIILTPFRLFGAWKNSSDPFFP